MKQVVADVAVLVFLREVPPPQIRRRIVDRWILQFSCRLQEVACKDRAQRFETLCVSETKPQTFLLLVSVVVGFHDRFTVAELGVP